LAGRWGYDELNKRKKQTKGTLKSPDTSKKKTHGGEKTAYETTASGSAKASKTARAEIGEAEESNELSHRCEREN